VSLASARTGLGPTRAAWLLLAFAGWCFPQGPPPVASPVRPGELAPVRMEVSAYGSHANRGYGDWRGLQGQLWIRSNPRFVPAFFYDSQTRPGGTQQNYAFFSYANWSKRFYTTQGFSYAPERPASASFFPRKRYDVKGWWKLPPGGNVILGAGYTRLDWGAPGHGQIFNAGLLYYRRKLIVGGDLFVNRNQPGNLVSGAGSLAVQYGREGDYWLGATVGGGRELYRVQFVEPSDVRLSGYSTSVFYRKWLSRHFGFVLTFDFQEKLDAYRRAGGAAGLFVEF
jgi:YaiO family outer membrane protein